MSEIDGAQIKQSQDPRFTALVTWGLPTIGLIAVAIVGWIGNRVADQLSDLNYTVTRLVTQNEAVFNRLDQNDRVDVRQDVQLNEISRDVAVIEGRVLRGQHPLQEPGRGN